MFQTIQAAMQKMEKQYGNGELAYICLTGKSESFIRDYLAIHLYKENSNWCREFKRIDLAEVENHSSGLLVHNAIELTSLYTC